MKVAVEHPPHVSGAEDGAVPAEGAGAFVPARDGDRVVDRGEPLTAEHDVMSDVSPTQNSTACACTCRVGPAAGEVDARELRDRRRARFLLHLPPGFAVRWRVAPAQHAHIDRGAGERGAGEDRGRGSDVADTDGGATLVGRAIAELATRVRTPAPHLAALDESTGVIGARGEHRGAAEVDDANRAGARELAAVPELTAVVVPPTPCGAGLVEGAGEFVTGDQAPRDALQRGGCRRGR